jgi:hypothetical protein
MEYSNPKWVLDFLGQELGLHVSMVSIEKVACSILFYSDINVIHYQLAMWKFGRECRSYFERKSQVYFNDACWNEYFTSAFIFGIKC